MIRAETYLKYRCSHYGAMGPAVSLQHQVTGSISALHSGLRIQHCCSCSVGQNSIRHTAAKKEKNIYRYVAIAKRKGNLLLFSFFLNFPFFFPWSFSSSDTISGGSWRLSWGGEGSPVRYNPGNLVGLISSELGVRVRPLPCSTRRCSPGLLGGGRKHSVMLPS